MSLFNQSASSQFTVPMSELMYNPMPNQFRGPNNQLSPEEMARRQYWAQVFGAFDKQTAKQKEDDYKYYGDELAQGNREEGFAQQNKKLSYLLGEY